MDQSLMGREEWALRLQVCGQVGGHRWTPHWTSLAWTGLPQRKGGQADKVVLSFTGPRSQKPTPPRRGRGHPGQVAGRTGHGLIMASTFHLPQDRGRPGLLSRGFCCQVIKCPVCLPSPSLMATGTTARQWPSSPNPGAAGWASQHSRDSPRPSAPQPRTVPVPPLQPLGQQHGVQALTLALWPLLRRTPWGPR